MTIDIAQTAGQMGLKFLSQHLPQAAQFTQKLVTGEGFNKVVGKLFPDGLSGSQKPQGLPPGLAKLFDPQKLPPHMSTKDAISQFKQFDLDQNGQLSKQELDQGLKDTQMRLETLRTKDGKAELSPSESKELDSLRMKKRFGAAMVKNYDALSNMDMDKTGISIQDIKNLANQDKAASNLSIKDWKNLLT